MAARRPLLGLVLFAIGVALGSGRAGAQQPAPPPAPPPQPAPERPDLPSKVAPDLPAFKVNGEVITVGQFIDRLSLIYGPAIRESLIDDTLIGQEMKRRGLTISPEELEEAANAGLGQTIREHGSLENVEAELMDKRGWSVAQYRYLLRGTALRHLRLAKLGEALVADYMPTEDELRAEYAANPGEFVRPSGVKVTHIMLRVPPAATEAQREAVRQRADDLRIRVIATAGANLEQIAREESEDEATRALGGKFPIFLQERGTPFGVEWEQLVFNAPVGLMRDVVPSVLGYHIVRLDEKRPAETLPFEEVEDQIRRQRIAQARTERVEDLLRQLRGGAMVSDLHAF